MKQAAAILRSVETPQSGRAGMLMRQAVAFEFIFVGALTAGLGWFYLADTWTPAEGVPWFFAVSLLLLLVFTRVYPRPWKTILWFAILGTVVAAMAAPHPRKNFLRDLYSIRPGMTVSQAVQRIGKYR